MNPMLEADCTSRCRSSRCASNLISVITRGTPHQIKTYVGGACQNAGHVADACGRTTLHMAASLGKFEIINWLVKEKHASLGAEDLESGWTALHRSIFHGQVIAAVYLISHGASIDKHDNEDLTPLEIAMKDHPGYAEYDPRGPSQVYSWGSNANFTLGHGGGKSRSQPDVVDRFARDGLSIKQVVMCKFHTVFLTHQGAVYTCGHGQGGRLGHGNEEVCLRPHPVTTLTGKVCEFVAAARDHTLFLMEDGTVFSCGQNSQHQLGHSSLGVKALTPKLISSKQIKHKTMLGVAAGRFHSVMHTKEAVYTFGLNAGQLGHAKGEKYVVSPRHVTTLHHDKVELTHVTTSDAATVCATKAGDIYVLNEYQCRKVASKQLNLLKIVASGGTLDSDLSDRTLQKKGGSELVLLVLNQSGQVYNWRSSSRALRRCAWTRKRQVFMSDVALSRQGVLFCTEEGEAFSGRFLGKKSSSSSHGKDSSQASPRASRDNVHSRDWPEDPEEMDRVSLNRVPAVHRAVRVACCPNGLDFAVLQADPKASLTEVPSVSPSLMVKHLSHLLTDADLSDRIHDVVLKVGHRSIPAHKYILTLRSDYFRCLFLQTSPRENHNSAHTTDAFDSFLVVKPLETHDVTDKTDFHTLMQLLQYIYSDTCDVFQSDFDFKSVPGTPRSPTTGLDVANDFDKLTITKENRHKSAYGVYKEHNEKKGNKEGGKKAKKDGGAKKNEADGMVYVRSLIDAAKTFGVASLVKRLDQVKFRDGRLWNFRPSAKPLHFHPRQLPQLADVVLCSEEGTLFPCHKCLLVARLEYFQSMLGSGWIEASSSDPLKMPLPASILSILLEYIYTDDAPSVRAATDVELLCNMLATADQLLISRLKEMCEVALVDLISLRNVAELLQFASVYRANQLKRTCHQYIGLNLACLLESRALEILSSDVLLELTEAYKEMIPSMPYRIITPYEEGPDISYIEEEPSTESSHSTSAEVMEGHTISFDRGDFDQIIRKAKAKRKASRRTSTGKRKSLSFSESGENNASSNQLPDVIPRTLPMEMDNLTIATDAIGDAGQGDSSTSASSVSSPTGQPKVDEAKERGRWEQEASRDSGNSEPESIPANPGNHNVSPSGVQSPPGKWIRKGWSETAVDEKTKRSLGTPEKAFGKDETQSKGWKSPSMLDITGPDLRSIMQSQASLTAASKKPLTTSRMTTPIAKKSQKQRKREQERAADSATSPPPTSPVEHPTPTCPWGGARKMAPASTSSFREVQMEEQKRIMGSTAVSTATSPPAKSRGLEQLSFGIVSRARRVSDNEPSMLVEAPPQEASPREVPENPWQHRATSPPAARVSFSEIIKLETEQRETLAKTLKKPFSLIQIEEKAIEELWAYYHTEDRVDEFVTVERATNVAATPLWRKGKDGS